MHFVDIEVTMRAAACVRELYAILSPGRTRAGNVSAGGVFVRLAARPRPSPVLASVLSGEHPGILPAHVHSVGHGAEQSKEGGRVLTGCWHGWPDAARAFA